MLKKKILAVICVSLLFLLLPSNTVTADLSATTISLKEREFLTLETTLTRFIERIESANDFEEVMDIIREIGDSKALWEFPVLKFIVTKITEWITKVRSLELFSNTLNGGDRGITLFSKSHFVMSFGSYHRWNPFKENKFKLFKQGFTCWHYRAQSKLFGKGRTVIVSRDPFAIKRVIGTQLGWMFGFRGLFFDIESRLTGQSYVLFLGRADRVRGLDLTPFSN